MYTSERFTVYDSFQLKKRKFVVFDVVEVSFQHMVLYKRIYILFYTVMLLVLNRKYLSYLCFSKVSDSLKYHQQINEVFQFGKISIELKQGTLMIKTEHG